MLAALALQPDVFDAGVDIFGVSCWLRTLQRTPSWAAQRDALLAEPGDPAADAERLRRISPLSHADRITKPPRASDPRVLQVESDVESTFSTATCQQDR